jgi:hypothetical protein
VDGVDESKKKGESGRREWGRGRKLHARCLGDTFGDACSSQRQSPSNDDMYTTCSVLFNPLPRERDLTASPSPLVHSSPT